MFLSFIRFFWPKSNVNDWWYKCLETYCNQKQSDASFKIFVPNFQRYTRSVTVYFKPAVFQSSFHRYGLFCFKSSIFTPTARELSWRGYQLLCQEAQYLCPLMCLFLHMMVAQMEASTLVCNCHHSPTHSPPQSGYWPVHIYLESFCCND